MKPIEEKVDKKIENVTTTITKPSNSRRNMFRTHNDEAINEAINESIKYAIIEGDIINTIIDENKDKLKYVKEAIQIFYDLESDDDIIDSIMYFFVEEIVKGMVSEKMQLRQTESSKSDYKDAEMNDIKLNGFLIKELYNYATATKDISPVYGNSNHITFYTNVFNIVAFNVTTSDSVTRIYPNPIIFENYETVDRDDPRSNFSLIQLILKHQEPSQEIEEGQDKFSIKFKLERQIENFDYILDNNINSDGYIDFINYSRGSLSTLADETFVEDIKEKLTGKDVAKQKEILENKKKELEKEKEKLEPELREFKRKQEKDILKEEFRQKNKEYFLFTTEGINSNANHYDYLEKKEYFEDYEISIFYEPEKIIMFSQL